VLTDVPAIIAGYGTPDARPIQAIDTAALSAMTFPAGSMGSKVEACIRFVSASGQPAAIGALTALPAAERDQVAARITALPAASAAAMPAEVVVSALGASADYGLSTAEAAMRRAAVGANALRDHSARPLAVLIGQFSSPLLILLMITAALSYALGQRTDAVIIGLILAASIGLGFANEYRAERAAEALHDSTAHRRRSAGRQAGQHPCHRSGPR
jgi:magnesium-transporting ATPase (P-type)